MRYPKTTQEKRQFFSAEEQGVRVRKQRSPKKLPDAWDDNFVELEYLKHKALKKKRQDRREQ